MVHIVCYQSTCHIVLKIIDFNSCILLQYKKFMVGLSLLLYSCHVNILVQKTACHWKENIIAVLYHYTCKYIYAH